MKKASLVIVIPIIVCVLAYILFFVRLGLAGKGIIHQSSMQDFGVCPDGTIIIGYMGKIEVFQDGKVVFSFRPPTSRAYRFYIKNDRVVIGCAAGYTKVYDAKGNFIEDSELSYGEVKSISQETKYRTESGELYKVVDSLGFKPFEIRCGEESIIKQDMLDYYFNGFPSWLLWAVGAINMATLLFALLYKYTSK